MRDVRRCTFAVVVIFGETAESGCGNRHGNESKRSWSDRLRVHKICARAYTYLIFSFRYKYFPLNCTDRFARCSRVGTLAVITARYLCDTSARRNVACLSRSRKLHPTRRDNGQPPRGSCFSRQFDSDGESPKTHRDSGISEYL